MSTERSRTPAEATVWRPLHEVAADAGALAPLPATRLPWDDVIAQVRQVMASFGTVQPLAETPADDQKPDA